MKKQPKDSAIGRRGFLAATGGLLAAAVPGGEIIARAANSEVSLLGFPAAKASGSLRKTVLLAEILDVRVIVGFSGCPGGTPQDTQPNWITYRWPPEYARMQDWQWKEKVIPYWKEAAKYARDHGIKRLAFEMHPNFVVYNPRTLMKLREAVGEEIGANCDLSHLFWQGCDPVEVIHFLGKQGALFHAHMKDTVFFPENVNKYGVLNFAFETDELAI